MAPTVQHETEKIFSSYKSKEAQQYAAIRRDYHPILYEAVIDRHVSTGGQLDTLLDAGCGPGLAAHRLASKFADVIGLDPSEGMVSTARSIAGVTRTGQPLRFEQSSAETLGSDLSPAIEDASVDLITASNAAHWFDMVPFWRSAARVLKSGGSVAMWASGPICADPSMPCAAEIQAAMDHILDNELEPYTAAGSLLTRNRYRDLVLPWTADPPIAGFEEASFFRREWQPGEPFFAGSESVDLNTLEKMLGSGSGVVRWRQAHPEHVGTEQDIVRRLRREFERILGASGVKPEAMVVTGSVKGTLLVVKKTA